MNLASSLAQLEFFELIRRLVDLEPTYLFKHALVQDTAQESLLKQDRKRLNKLVAQTLERVYAEQLDEYAARLAQHYNAAGEDTKTIQYAERAGDVAFRVYARPEAQAQYSQALALAKLYPEQSEQLVRLYLQLGRTLELDLQYDRALALYQEMEEFGRARGDRALELAALVQRASVYSVHTVHYHPDEAVTLCQKAAQLAQELGDRRAEAKIEWCLMLLNVYGSGGARAGLVHGEKSLRLARELRWTQQMAFTLNDLAYIYLNLGDLARVRQAQTEARKLWRELDDKPMLTDNLNSSAMEHLLRGEFQTAHSLLDESDEISHTIGNQWGECAAAMVRGFTQLEQGALAAAFETLHECLRLGAQVQLQGPTLMSRFELGQLFALFGDFANALHHVQEGIDLTLKYHLDWDAWGYAALANVELTRGAVTSALAAIQRVENASAAHYMERLLPNGAFTVISTQAQLALLSQDAKGAHTLIEYLLNYAESGGMTLFLPWVLCLRAEYFLARQKPQQAANDLERALAICTEQHSLRHLWRIYATYMRVEQARHRPQRAAAFQEKAKQALDELAVQVPPQYREGFLTTPLVQNALGTEQRTPAKRKTAPRVPNRRASPKMKTRKRRL